MKNLKERFEAVLPYFMVTLMLYYGGPLFMLNDDIAIIIMGVLLPIGSILVGFVCGLKAGFQPFYSLLALLCFIPQYWLNLPDWAAWTFYAIMYIGGGFLGMIVGWLVDRIVKKLMVG